MNFYKVLLTQVWSCQCKVLKLPPRATLMQSIFNNAKLPNPQV